VAKRPSSLRANAEPVDPDAYDPYLRGRDARFSSEGQDDLERSEQYFRLAIGKQPGYAQAWAGLAETLFLIWGHQYRPEEALVPEIREAADRALALDGTAPEAHVTAAMVHSWIDEDLARAEKDILRALELDPRHWNAHREYAQLLKRMGRLDEALAQYQWVHQRDPLSEIALEQLGHIHFLRREFDDALEYFEKRSLKPLLLVTASLVAKGATFDEVRGLLRAREDDPSFRTSLAYAHAVAGQDAEALKLLEASRLAESSYLRRYCDHAAVQAALGRDQEALGLLAEAASEALLWPCDVEVNWLYDPLRSDPRFADLLSREGLEP